MLLSKMIHIMQEVMATHGDHEVNMMVDLGKDNKYPVRIKQVELNTIPAKDFDNYFILESERKNFFLNLGEYNEDKDSLYDMKAILGVVDKDKKSSYDLKAIFGEDDNES